LAANQTDTHVKLPRHFDIDRYLCIKTPRTVRNDNTIAHDGKLYQLAEDVSSKQVTVEERVDGSVRIRSAGVNVRYRQITERAKKAVPEAKTPKPRKLYVPPKDHPWRKDKASKSLPQWRNDAFRIR